MDFRVNHKYRIQDKVALTHFSMRGRGKKPYNPDDFDVFQVSDIKDNVVYALPMRFFDSNWTVKSFFSEKQLMATTVVYNDTWKKKYASYKHDLNTENGARSYVSACKKAYDVGLLADRHFFYNIIEKNSKKFGSKSRMKKI